MSCKGKQHREIIGTCEGSKGGTGRKRFLEVLHHRPGVTRGGPCSGGTGHASEMGVIGARSWDPVRVLGLVLLGQTPAEDA